MAYVTDLAVLMLRTMLILATVQGSSLFALTAPEILERMVRADNERATALAGYTGVRRYSFDNRKSNKHAELTVRMSCGGNGVKSFEIIAESGSEFVRDHILRKMIEAEVESSKKGEHKETRIVPENYDFRLVGTEVSEGRDSYVFEISPKKPSEFSIRGRIWVDAEDFAVARIEGQPAKNPSFWIRSVQVVQRYRRTDQFWLPNLNHSVAQAKFFGTTEVTIEYSDYKTNVRDVEARARPEQ